MGTALSAALLLRYSLKLEREAAALEKAVEQAIAAGQLTGDVGGKLNTTQVAQAIIANLSA